MAKQAQTQLLHSNLAVRRVAEQDILPRLTQSVQHDSTVSTRLLACYNCPRLKALPPVVLFSESLASPVSVWRPLERKLFRAKIKKVLCCLAANRVKSGLHSYLLHLCERCIPLPVVIERLRHEELKSFRDPCYLLSVTLYSEKWRVRGFLNSLE